MIVFTKIKIRNFFSVGNVPIEISLNSHKKTLCIGRNGSAKSSCLLDSVTFALFGKPYRKINKPNLINSINKGNCVVEVEFSISSKNYKIVRGLKPTIFEIYCNNVLINQSSNIKDYQEYLEKYILKTNYKAFINVVILGSARYTPFMSLTAAERRSIIEELLDIEVFTTMNILLKDKLSKVKDDLTSTNYQIEIIKEKINLQKQHLKQNKKSINDQIKTKQGEIDKCNVLIEKLQNDVKLIQRHNDILISTISDKDTIEKKRKKLITIETKLETGINKLKKEFEFYSENDSCPTCKQDIYEEFKSQQIEKNSIKLEEFSDGMKKLNDEILNVENRIKEIKKISTSIQEHQTEIVRLNSSISTTQTFIQKELKEIAKITNSNQMLESDKVLTNFQSDLDKLNDKLKEITEEKKYYDFIALLLKDGGIKTKIIKQYLPVLNKIINMFLGKLNFFVNFNIDENFNEVIKSRHRDAYQYESFSEGEKLRIDVSLIFAFRQIAKMKNSMNTNLLIMDEILDSSADAEYIENFIELLNTFDDTTNIFIISHRQDQTENFDRILKFEKVKNFTRVKQL